MHHVHADGWQGKENRAINHHSSYQLVYDHAAWEEDSKIEINSVKTSKFLLRPFLLWKMECKAHQTKLGNLTTFDSKATINSGKKLKWVDLEFHNWFWEQNLIQACEITSTTSNPQFLFLWGWVSHKKADTPVIFQDQTLSQYQTENQKKSLVNQC